MGRPMNFLWDEVSPNHQRGFATFWPVYEDYVIIDGSLCWHGEPTYSYAPMVHKEIPSELARLKRGDEAGVLQFARTYGSLGYQKFLPPAPGLWKPIGDPLRWIWAHAETIRFCLEVSELLQQDDLHKLKNVLRAQHITPEDIEELCEPEQVEELKYTLCVAQSDAGWVGRKFFSTMLVAERDKVRLAWGELPNRKACTKLKRMNYLTRYFRNGIINANIQGVVRSLSVTPRPTIKERSYWRFTTLIETAYWHLADMVDGGTVKRCEGCHGVFIRTDARQLFCPPPYNHGSSTRPHSRCGTRKRVTELRRRREAQGSPSLRHRIKKG
jgi:hypothetical protein